MRELLKQIDPEVLLLVGIIIGQTLKARSLREHGKRIGRLAGRVNKIAGHIGLKDGEPDGGE